jgi:hypothetical protein
VVGLLAADVLAAGFLADVFFWAAFLRPEVRFGAVARRPDPGRAEAERRSALGFFAELRRREEGPLSPSPPPLPPLDRLAMTASRRRGQREPSEDERASDHA